MEETQPIYKIIGGESTLRLLVDRFYDIMNQEAEVKALRDIHNEDLSDARQKLFEFLSGWTGGPSLFSDKYGHPRLRARHMHFKIDRKARDQWLYCMNKALDETIPSKEAKIILKNSLARLADHMRNQSES